MARLRLRRQWNVGKPEFLIVTGSVVALGASGAWFVVLSTTPIDGWPWPAALSAASLALCGVTLVAIATRSVRNAKQFAAVGGVASAFALLTPAALAGGTIALTGAVWGIVARYEKPPSLGPS